MEGNRKIDLFSTFINVLKVVKVEVHCYDDVKGKIFKILSVLDVGTGYGLRVVVFD